MRKILWLMDGYQFWMDLSLEKTPYCLGVLYHWAIEHSKNYAYCIPDCYTTTMNVHKVANEQGNVLFNDALNTFYGYTALDIW